MSIGGVLGAIKGAGQGMENNRAHRLKKEAGDRAQSELEIAQAEEKRKEYEHANKAVYDNAMVWREAVDNPPPQQMATQNPQYNAQQGIPVPGAPAAGGAPAAAPVAGGTPAPAIPTKPEMAGPTQEPAAPKVGSKRRERYQEYLKRARAAAFRAGGAQGLAEFNKLETAMTMHQIMGYGLQASTLLHGGDVMGAVKQGNTALEATEFDTGLKFEAFEGEAYLVGANGKRGKEPITGTQMQAYIDKNMRDPDAFLAWSQRDDQVAQNDRMQTQSEIEGNAAIKTAEGNLAVSEGNLAVSEGKLAVSEGELAVRERLADMQQDVTDNANKAASGDRAKTHASIVTSIYDSETRRMAARAQMDAAKRAELDGKTDTIKLKIMNDIPTLLQNGKLPNSQNWLIQTLEDPANAALLQGSMVDLVMMNDLSDANYSDAIALTSFAFARAFGEEPSTAIADALGVPPYGKNADGTMWADFQGKRILLPRAIYESLRAQDANAPQDTQ